MAIARTMSGGNRVPEGARPTINSVAAHATVSRQTVSNALNAPEKLRPDTLARVQDAIATLGYRPHNAARSLRSQSTRLLACRLLPSNRSGTGGVLDLFLHALCTASRRRGYDVLTFSAASDDAEVAVLDDLIQRHAVDAFVLTETHFDDPRSAWLLDRGASFIAFGRPWGQERFSHSWVDVDGRAGVSQAVDHLAAQGHHRIGFIGWPEGSGSGQDRHDGWLAAVRRHRLATQALVVRGQDGIVDGARLTNVLLDRGRPPTAIVCVSDAMAIGALNALADRGLRAGHDVAVVGFDDSPVASAIRPGLTSVHQPLETVAETALELLLDHVHGHRDEPAGVLIPPTLSVRGSSIPAGTSQ